MLQVVILYLAWASVQYTLVWLAVTLTAMTSGVAVALVILAAVAVNAAVTAFVTVQVFRTLTGTYWPNLHKGTGSSDNKQLPEHRCS